MLIGYRKLTQSVSWTSNNFYVVLVCILAITNSLKYRWQKWTQYFYEDIVSIDFYNWYCPTCPFKKFICHKHLAEHLSAGVYSPLSLWCCLLCYIFDDVILLCVFVGKPQHRAILKSLIKKKKQPKKSFQVNHKLRVCLLIFIHTSLYL